MADPPQVKDTGTGPVSLSYKNVLTHYPSPFDSVSRYSEVSWPNPLQESLKKI